MCFHYIDPLRDSRWPEFLERHPRATVFHTPAWLAALHRTYGYEPVVLTTSAPGHQLANGLTFCRVRSWLTGRRLVSLPFSDHCDLLGDTAHDSQELLSGLRRECIAGDWKSAQIRPLDSDPGVPAAMEPDAEFCFHSLDIRPSLEDLFHRFHKDCVQRKIHRAEREGLSYKAGRPELLLQCFYHLIVITRRRQRLPPQPIVWFRNLIGCLGDKLKIRIVSQKGQPIAAILTIQYKNTLVYKYGCLDKRFANKGGMQLLFWNAIQEAKRDGLMEFDMGRSDLDNSGLIQFKDRWGTTRSTLVYYRYSGQTSQVRDGLQVRLARRMIAVVPDRLLATAGGMLYRHLG